MWGSSFADLAKKAQELQEQASNLSAGEIFNLDAIQSAPVAADKKNLQRRAPQHQPAATPAQPPPAQPSFQLPSPSTAAHVANPTVMKPQVQKGKLKMNLSSNSNQPKISGLSKGKGGSKPGLVTKLAVSEETPAINAVVNQKEPAAATDVAPTKEKLGPGLAEPSTEPELKGDAKTSQSGTDDDLLPPMNSFYDDNESNNISPSEQQKSVNNIQPETSQAKSKESPGTPKDQEAVSPEPASTDEAAPIESFSNAMSNDAVVDSSSVDGEIVAKDEGRELKTEDNVEAVQVDVKTKDNFENETTKQEAEDMLGGTANQPPGWNEPTDESKEATPNSQEFPVVEDSKEEPAGPDKNVARSDPAISKSNKDGAVAVVGTPETETSKVKIKPVPEAAVVDDRQHSTSSLHVAPSNGGADAERVMQQFTAQLQRIEAGFEDERKETRQKHQSEINNTICAKEKEMEQLLAKMKEKDLKVRDLKRTKEGNELRMDSLKREVEGIKELLKQRDIEIEDLKKTRDDERKQLEKQVRAVESQHVKAQKELKGMQDELEKSKGELGRTHDEYTTLKSRVKVVASELKERRVECRDLKTKIEELEESNEKHAEHVSTLESHLSDRDRSGNDKDEEVGGLRSIIEQLEQKLKDAGNAAKSKDEKFEKDLGGYKKKAQNSLAVANSRAAAAVQAKEEAELEARAARSTADSTMERARVAEEKGVKAMADAKEYYREMEEAKTEAIAKLKAHQEELDQTKESLSGLQEKLDTSASEKGNLAAEKAQIARDAETERTKSANLQIELTGAQHRLGVLENDRTELRNKLQIAEATAAHAKETQQPNQASPAPVDDSTTRATIMMLQSQLKEANETIKELTEALQNAIELSETPQGQNGEAVAGEGLGSSSNGNDGVPSFYAMEKQAELNTARNEINRLSSLYADVQSEKSEAQEALVDSNKALAEERSKLQRYEKLSSASSSSNEASPSNVNGADNKVAGSDGRTNIEYLKNIMLSFLHAKTITEKKALVPVIGAVLCLTTAEQARAIQNVESTGGLEGFGSAFFETIGSKVGR